MVEHATENDRHLPASVRQFLADRKRAEASLSLEQRRAITRWSKRGDGSLIGWSGNRVAYDAAEVRARKVLAEVRARKIVGRSR
jgi:hypothetical protein